MPTTLALDLELLDTIFRHAVGRVTYELGAKAPSLDCDTSRIQSIDCSGWVRYEMARIGRSLVGFDMPDGSQAQRAWCERMGFKHSTYDEGGAGRKDGLLRLAVASPDPGHDWPRHVWLIRDGETNESYGGVGVGSRAWNDPVLKRIVSACFVLTA